MYLKTIIPLCRDFVTNLFETKLGKDLSFLDFNHTQGVVNAIQEICLETNLTTHETEILTLAGWFHDTGYTQAYLGHEIFSTMIAREFLTLHRVDTDLIEQINGCIMATRFPQNPKDTMENVICDADLHHFSKPDYVQIADQLRKEWQHCMGTCYTDHAWDIINLKMLCKHAYFTDYGRTVLQERKNKNIYSLKSIVLNLP